MLEAGKSIDSSDRTLKENTAKNKKVSSNIERNEPREPCYEVIIEKNLRERMPVTR